MRTRSLLRNLVISSALSVLLVLLRVEWSGSIRYVFLPWNLFLAWLPFMFALGLQKNVLLGGRRYMRHAWFCCWLLFFPNSPYILTDLFHLQQRPGIPLWFDLVLLLSFAWNGLLLAYGSLFIVKDILLQKLKSNLVTVMISGLLILCSFGIYLGRYPRYNSWDIFTQPLDLLAEITDMALHPFDNTRMVGMTFFFSIFLISGYFSLIALAGSIKQQADEQ